MIRLEQLNLVVGSFALRNISLHVRPGEYLVLLGPTGSGKTLLLECLCGLNRIDSGRIFIDGVDVTAFEPRRRRLGYLPQDYALFPHRTVRGNIGFALAANDRGRVAELMDLIGVAHLADRFPQKLSGGEKQRVALARALAIAPRVLLLDEPVSALDEQTRDTLCRELKQLQQHTQTTTIHVCHNFDEMLAVGDRVGIIDGGRILQLGTPQEVIERPGNERAAEFVRAGNLFPARASADGPGLRLICPHGIELKANPPDAESLDDEVVAMVRPENIRLTARRGHDLPDATGLEGVIGNVIDLGAVVRVNVDCGGLQWLVSLGKREYNSLRFGVGDHVGLVIAPENVHVMSRGTGP